MVVNNSNWNYGVMGVVSGTGTSNGDVYGLGYNSNASFIPVLNWTSTGKVGIGTTSPSQLLQVNNGSTIRFQVAPLAGVWVNNEVNGGTSDSPGPLFLNYTSHNNTLLNSYGGNVGIGITNPASQLDVFHNGTGPVLRVGGNAVGTSSDAAIDLYANNANNVPTYARIALGLNTGTVGSETGYLNFSIINAGTLTEKMRLTAEGNVLIGKTSEQPGADYKLDVGGSVRADKIVVNTSGADFVFDKKYSLPKLSDVKSYIDHNQHLPEIPSAKEMQTNGMSVGEINTKLLQKVEELTLYLIDKDKQLTEQQKKNDEQEARIAALEKMISKLVGNPSK